jgi:hypothetical protein
MLHRADECRLRRLRERAVQQVLPARQEQRAIVELDREQIARREMLVRGEIVAQLARARADVVAAVAEQGEHVSADGALVRRPEPLRCRIGDAGHRVGIEPAVPGDIGRQQRIGAADALRNASRDRPCDVARAIGDDDVLRRNAADVRDRDCLVGALGVRHVAQAEINCAGLLGGPFERERRAVGVGGDDRPPFGVFDGERLVGAAAHVNRFCVLLDRRPIARDANPVGRVDVAVRETPRDVAVAAERERRQAGQRDAVRVGRRAGMARARIDEPRAEPETRHAELEVRVVRHQRRAAGQRAGDCEPVAADDAIADAVGGFGELRRRM